MPSNNNDSNHRSPMNDKIILAITTADRTGAFLYENQYLHSVKKKKKQNISRVFMDTTRPYSIKALWNNTVGSLHPWIYKHASVINKIKWVKNSSAFGATMSIAHFIILQWLKITRLSWNSFQFFILI